jgi:cysteine synthase
MIYQSTHEAVGRTPHLRIAADEGGAGRFYVKLEGANPTGSVKDRAGLAMVQEVAQSGSLIPGAALLDASSGNMACALAYFGRALGLPVRVVVSSKLTDDKRRFLQFYGADVVSVGDFTIEGNRWCGELAEREGPGRWCFLDQLHNWANPRAHYDTTGPEIAADFAEVELVVASLGSGGTLYGTGRFLKDHVPGVRVVAVESAPGTRLPGTGSFCEGDYVTPFIARGRAEVFDHTVRVTLGDAERRALELRDQGVFCGLQTGGVYHAAQEAARELGVRGDVVVISGDSGWKNMDKLLPLAAAHAEVAA